MEGQIELWVTGIDYNGDNIGRNFEFKLKSGIVLCRDPQEAGIIGRLEVVS